jgi:hypothetical protein
MPATGCANAVFLEDTLKKEPRTYNFNFGASSYRIGMRQKLLKSLIYLLIAPRTKITVLFTPEAIASGMLP